MGKQPRVGRKLSCRSLGDLESRFSAAVRQGLMDRGVSSACVCETGCYFAPSVMPFQLSVRNGEAGSPAELYRLAGGFDDQP